jgi:TRAP-type C4-dicarboxylate transport system substrate-binding protein
MHIRIKIWVLCVSFLGMVSFFMGFPPAGADAAPAKPMVLKSSVQTPAGVPLTKILDWWTDEVEKRSGGRVKFEKYPGETLAKGAEQLSAVQSGIADVALVMPIYTPGKTPLNTATNMPFNFGQAWINATAYLQWVRSVPEVEDEFTKLNIKVVSAWGTGPYYLLSSRPIRTIEDFKGKKIITVGPPAELIKALRGAPMAVIIPEAYEALQRKTVDGGIYGPSAAGSYHLEEVCKYYLKLPLAGACGPIAMNMDTWKKLPPDIQKIINDLAPEHAKALHKIYQIDGDGKYMEIFKRAGVEMIEPSESMYNEVRKLAQEVVWSKWVSDQESRKLPGKKVLDEYLSIMDKTKKLSPFN